MSYLERQARTPQSAPIPGSNQVANSVAAGVGDEATRKAALAALARVCRTSTHLFQFASFVEGFRGWGRSPRRAVAPWYAGRSPESLAYQSVKYRSRESMTHRDLLRLAHPAARVGSGNPTLALVTAATETRYGVVGFCHRLKQLAISPRQRLDDAVRTVSNLPFGSTDCSQPMLYALDKEREIDTFVIYTTPRRGRVTCIRHRPFATIARRRASTASS